jgi:hypothetical protein
VLHPSDLEPVAAGDPERIVVAPAPLPEGLSAWVLELGEASRGAELRSAAYSAQGFRLQAWRSRRENARTRRRFVEALLAGNGPAEAIEDIAEEQLEFDLVPRAPLPRPPVIVELEEIAELEEGAPNAVYELPAIATALPPESFPELPVEQPAADGPDLFAVELDEVDEVAEEDLGPALSVRIAAYTLALPDDSAFLDSHWTRIGGADDPDREAVAARRDP